MSPDALETEFLPLSPFRRRAPNEQMIQISVSALIFAAIFHQKRLDRFRSLSLGHRDQDASANQAG